MKNKQHIFTQESKAFVMPMVLIMMTTILYVMLVVGQAIVANQRRATVYNYTLIARAASKAAVDYAKEELDSNLSYCGTPENRNTPGSDPASTVLYDSPSYKITYEVQIFDGNCTGSGRNIRAVGRVYIPDISTTAAYVQDIRVRLVQSSIYDNSPGDFSPVGWYRSNVATSVRQSATNSYSNTFNYASRIEEQLNGTTQSAVCGGSNNDLEFHTGNENTGVQRIGLNFHGINIPKDATITQAYIQFRSGGTSGTGGSSGQLSQSLSTRITAFDTANKSDFSCPGGSQLTSSSGLTSSVDWAMPSWSSANQSGSAQRTPDLTTAVQALVNRSDWVSGNNMGFRFERISGTGLRPANVSQASYARMYIAWETAGGSAQATNGSTVMQWQDQTSNGNHLDLLSGAPVLRTNVLNGRQVIELKSVGGIPALLGDASFSPAISNNTGMTVVAVMRLANTASGTGDDRYVGLVNSAQPNDTLPPAANGNVRAFMRSGSSTNLTASANSFTAQALNSVIGTSVSSGSWGVYAFTINNNYFERYSRNGSPNALYDGGTSSSFNVNQLFIGGTSSAASTYTLPGDLQIAELVVYDKPISCSQIRLIENYFEQSSSWAITSADYNCSLQ